MVKLIALKELGLLAKGATFYDRKETADRLIEKGYAELHPEQDSEPQEMERLLYKDDEGNWRTKEVLKTTGEEPVTEEPKQKRKAKE